CPYSSRCPSARRSTSRWRPRRRAPPERRCLRSRVRTRRWQPTYYSTNASGRAGKTTSSCYLPRWIRPYCRVLSYFRFKTGNGERSDRPPGRQEKLSDRSPILGATNVSRCKTSRRAASGRLGYTVDSVTGPHVSVRLPAEACGRCPAPGGPMKRGGSRRMTSEPRNGRKRATIWEVARAAGVSHQTVSRYLRNEGGLRPATREKIDRAVAELDYRPNLIARSMRTRRTNRIAIVLPELTSFVPIPVLKGAAQTAREAGYSTDVVGLEGDAVRRAEGALALLDSRQVDGLLSFTPLSDTVIAPGDRRPIVIYGE